MPAHNLADLPREERVRVVAKAIVRMAVVYALLLIGYAIVPIGHRSDLGTVLLLLVLATAFVAMLVLEVRAIMRAEFPAVRAANAVAITIAVFLVGFAVIYLTMSASNARHFTEPLNRFDAMYLTVAVFSTVGFGDITPLTNPARALVSIQMLLDLVLLGVIVRLLFGAGRQRARGVDDSPGLP